MTDTCRRRWLTVLSDGILSEIGGRHSGFQVVQATGYDVGDFIGSLADGTVKIKADVVALCVGNDQLRPGQNINMARQIEKLIRQIWIVKPTASIFVSSLMPKPTQETLTQSVVMKANKGISVMCRRLNKYETASVEYMPLHQGFLEKYKKKDERSGSVKVLTRVIQPHGIYYKIGTDILNNSGVAFYLRSLENRVRKALGQPESSGIDLTQMPGIKVQIDNEVGNSPVPHSGQKLKKGKLDADWHTVLEQKTRHGERKSETGLRGPCVDRGEKNVKRRKMSAKSSTETTETFGHKATVKRPRRHVADMVEKWEMLSQGPLSDDIDRELGEESVVRVDLGDSPQGTKASLRGDDE